MWDVSHPTRHVYARNASLEDLLSHSGRWRSTCWRARSGSSADKCCGTLWLCRVPRYGRKLLMSSFHRIACLSTVIALWSKLWMCHVSIFKRKGNYDDKPRVKAIKCRVKKGAKTRGTSVQIVCCWSRQAGCVIDRGAEVDGELCRRRAKSTLQSRTTVLQRR